MYDPGVTISWKLRRQRENDLLYKGETVVLIMVEGGDEHVAFGFAHYHVVVLEEQEEV